METSQIENIIKNLIPDNPDSQAFYQSLIGNINALSPIKSFLINVNTGQGTQDTNLTIITFEHLPKSLLRQQIIDQVNYDSDEYPEFKYLVNQDILILSFDF